MAGRAFGNASDYYRLRLIHLDQGEGPDLDWRDDILWREPPAAVPEERLVYRIEAVDLDDEDHVIKLAHFEEENKAHDWLAQAQQDLDTMTKTEFEAARMPEEELGEGLD